MTSDTSGRRSPKYYTNAFFQEVHHGYSKKTYALLALALAFTTGMAVVTVIAYTDQAMAFATVTTHEDQAVGGCSGSGC